MTVAVEYLLIVPKAGTFCDSIEAFNRLLRIDSSIVLSGGKLTHRGNFSCSFAITSEEIPEKDQRYFHLRFSIDNEDEHNVVRFQDLLRAIRTITSLVTTHREVLWDDISTIFCRDAYTMIHRTENLMRKLIANFMLVNVGSQWVKEAAPLEIKEALAKSKRQDDDESDSNALQALDFIHLASFLLRPYSSTQPAEFHHAVKNATSETDLANLKVMVPESNWTRYFSKIVECDDQFLKLRWDELYQLRAWGQN